MQPSDINHNNSTHTSSVINLITLSIIFPFSSSSSLSLITNCTNRWMEIPPVDWWPWWWWWWLDWSTLINEIMARSWMESDVAIWTTSDDGDDSPCSWMIIQRLVWVVVDVRGWLTHLIHLPLHYLHQEISWNVISMEEWDPWEDLLSVCSLLQYPWNRWVEEGGEWGRMSVEFISLVHHSY